MPAWPGRVIHTSPRYTLMADVGTTHCAVEGIRLGADELAEAIAKVDAFLHETDTTIASWWLTERSTPDERAYLDAGLALDDSDYLHAAMLLTREPPPSDIEAHELVTLDEYVEARRLAREVFDVQDEVDLEREFAGPHDPVYGAWVDGRLASVGRATLAACGIFLSGGATAPWARGRGAYRAVVRARWDAAVARGTPALAVGAGAMSRPILERLGFEQVLQYRRLQSVRSHR
jgi:hypothetical protein